VRRALAATLTAAVAAAAGCGEGDEARTAGSSKPVGKEVAGSVVQFADCGDWNDGTRDERVATIAALRGQLTPTRSETAASPLPDERAYAILEKACSPAYAESLRLYKLYVRAQAFAPLSE
jgi:hypothetical protein